MAAAVLHVLGVGGYRFGPVWVMLALVAGGGALAGWMLRGDGSRWSWTAVIAVIGLIAGGVLVDRAVLSKGSLSSRMDGLQLPFFDVAEERSSGHSWCRPACPRVARTYRGPNVGVRPAMLAVATALARDELIPESLLGTIGNDRTFTASATQFDIRVQIGEVDDGRRIVTVTYRAIRPAG